MRECAPVIWVKTKKSGLSNEAKYHAVPVSSGLVGTRQVAKNAAMRSTLSEECTPRRVKAKKYASAPTGS
ncbi:MAG: hypothetical protein LBS07_04500 [Prevotellaceae bacterium]|nr:hypothetical protein [Prevotellaceae bacterium]